MICYSILKKKLTLEGKFYTTAVTKTNLKINKKKRFFFLICKNNKILIIIQISIFLSVRFENS